MKDNTFIALELYTSKYIKNNTNIWKINVDIGRS